MPTLFYRNVLRGHQKLFYVQLTLRNAATNSIHCVPGSALSAIYMHMC